MLFWKDRLAVPPFPLPPWVEAWSSQKSLQKCQILEIKGSTGNKHVKVTSFVAQSRYFLYFLFTVFQMYLWVQIKNIWWVFRFGAFRKGIRRTGAPQPSGDNRKHRIHIEWKTHGYLGRVEQFFLLLEKKKSPQPKYIQHISSSSLLLFKLVGINTTSKP